MRKGLRATNSTSLLLLLLLNRPRRTKGWSRRGRLNNEFGMNFNGELIFFKPASRSVGLPAQDCQLVWAAREKNPKIPEAKHNGWTEEGWIGWHWMKCMNEWGVHDACVALRPFVDKRKIKARQSNSQAQNGSTLKHLQISSSFWKELVSS